MFCCQCGTKIQNNGKFCSNCGSPCYQSAEKPPQTEHQPKTQKTVFQQHFSSNNTPFYQRIFAFNGELILTFLLIVIPFLILLSSDKDIIIAMTILLPILLRLTVYAFTKKTIWGNILGFEYVDQYNQPISILKYGLRLFLKIIVFAALYFIIKLGGTLLLLYELASTHFYFGYVLAPFYLLGLAAGPFLLLLIGLYFQWCKKDYAPHMFYDRWCGIQVQKTKNSRIGYIFTLILVIFLIVLSINAAYQQNKDKFLFLSNNAEQCYRLFEQAKYDDAFPLCLNEANQGDAKAQNHVGRIYRVGTSTIAKNDELSLYYLQQSASQGYSSSDYYLGAFYLENKPDINMAKYYFEIAANRGYSKALISLGHLHYYEYYTPTSDFAKAKTYYEQAAAKGHTEAYLKLGEMYYFGHGVTISDRTAKQYYELATDQAEALYKLGWIYMFSKEIAHDQQKAKNYFELADRQNHAKAQVQLGHIYSTTQNYAMAKYYYEKAASQNDSQGQFFLGELYYSVKKGFYDIQKAVYYFGLSAAQGDESGQFSLGIAYLLGDGVPKDLKKAEYYLTLSANQGNKNAQEQLKVLKSLQRYSH